MSALLPRLDRDRTTSQLEQSRELSLQKLTDRMPVVDVTTTSAPVGGLELGEDTLGELRSEILALAREHGFPDTHTDLSRFDAKCARIVHRLLRLSPHEASEHDAWSYLTCCWLLDIAAWRWERDSRATDDRRFRGDVNRNTFRRLWWRAEVLGPDIDLTKLGEDELVNIMERTSITANRRLARVLVSRFLVRVEADPARRMMLMRETAKRLLRLTPMVEFHALNGDELTSFVDEIIALAATGGALAAPAAVPSVPRVSDNVEVIPRMPAVDHAHGIHDGPSTPRSEEELPDHFAAAIQIARRTGRVTNSSLREVVQVDAPSARGILQTLVERGELIRRGRAKGTYYVLPSEAAGEEVEPSSEPESRIGTVSAKAASISWSAPTPVRRNRSAPDSALRRLLRRTPREG